MQGMTGDMGCEECERAIPWLLDDELEGVYEREVEKHLSWCEACRDVLEREGRLRKVLRRASHSMAAPARLRRRLAETIESERKVSAGGWGRYAPVAAAALILLSFVWRGASDGYDADLNEAVARHTRNLPMDVSGPEPVSVQRYLSGKLPFAVTLPGFSGPDQKMGGRVTRFNDREAAYVRYELPRGRVSMFVYPDPGYGLPERVPMYKVGNRQVYMMHVRGYPAAMWRQHGLVYSLVSDLPEEDFERVVLRRKAALQTR